MHLMAIIGHPWGTFLVHYIRIVQYLLLPFDNKLAQVSRHYEDFVFDTHLMIWKYYAYTKYVLECNWTAFIPFALNDAICIIIEMISILRITWYQLYWIIESPMEIRYCLRIRFWRTHINKQKQRPIEWIHSS